MKRFPLRLMISFLLMISVLSSSQLTVAKSIKRFSIPYGEGKSKLAINKPEQLYFGPTDFDVAANGDVYVLDYLESQLEVFSKKGKFIKTISLDTQYSQMALADDGKIYLIEEQGSFAVYQKGKAIHQQTLNVQFPMLIEMLFIDEDQTPVLRIHDSSPKPNREFHWKKNRLIEKSYIPQETFTTDPHTDQPLKTIHLGSETISISYHEQVVGYPLFKSKNNERYVYEMELIMAPKMYVETRLVKYKNGQRIATALGIYNDFDRPLRNLAIRNDTVYQLVGNKNTMDLFTIPFGKKSTNISPQLIKKLKP